MVLSNTKYLLHQKFNYSVKHVRNWIRNIDYFGHNQTCSVQTIRVNKGTGL